MAAGALECCCHAASTAAAPHQRRRCVLNPPAPCRRRGRLVTAQQLHAEAAAMLGEERYSDSLAILELSVLLRLYPFQPPGQLAAWQRGMTLAGAGHPRCGEGEEGSGAGTRVGPKSCRTRHVGAGMRSRWPTLVSQRNIPMHCLLPLCCLSWIGYPRGDVMHSSLLLPAAAHCSCRVRTTTPWQPCSAVRCAAVCRVRLQLARTLVLVARARAGAGAAGVATAVALTHDDLELLEGAVLAAEAALALFQTEGELA